MRSTADRRLRGLVLVGCFLVAVVAAAWAIRPWLAAPVAFDVAASVLHFQRLIAGRQMEEPYLILTTPKPLLTLIYGVLYSIGQDWRAISVVVIAIWGLCVALAAELAWRLAGIVAALFVAAALVCSASLLIETARALGSIWALLLWLVAGLAVTANRPRWGVAGAALALATLARLETFLIVGLALAVLVVLRWGPGSIRRPVPAGAWLVAVGLVGLPIILVHDWRLTGDPFFFSNVSLRYSAEAASDGRLPDVVDVAKQLAVRVERLGLASILAVAGFALLAVRRSWPILVGVVALGPGVAVFLLVLAARGVFVDPRYYLPIQLTILFTAGIGFSAIRVPEVSGYLHARRVSVVERHRAGLVASGVALGAIVVAVVTAPTVAPINPAILARIVQLRDQARTSDLARPVLLEAISDIPGMRTSPDDATAGVNPAPDPILVPRGMRARLIVDLDLPIPRVRSIDPRRLDPSAGVPADGQLIVIDKGMAVPPGPYRPFEVSEPTEIGGRRLVPLLADPAHGAWVVRVEDR